MLSFHCPTTGRIGSIDVAGRPCLVSLARGEGRKTAGTVSLDFSGKLNGRGAYLCPDPECLKKAQKAKSLERSLEVPIPEEVYDRLAKEMEGANG